MTPQFSTITLLSTHLWLDNWILQRGQAYTNTTSRLYYQADSGLGSAYVAYASPFRQWVCDSGVSGALVTSRVSGSIGIGGTGIVNRGQSGMIIDYENGRVIFPSIVGTGHLITGSYAFKDINIYKANETLEKMVFTNKYYLNSRYARPITGIPPPRDMVTPCMFVTSAHTTNKPWTFGGVYYTTNTVSLVVLAETMNQLEGSLSLLTDAKDACFPQLNLNVWPLNSFGDYKSGYNYEIIKNQYGTPGNLYTIVESNASKVGDDAKIDDNIFIGLVDLTICKPRSIH